MYCVSYIILRLKINNIEKINNTTEENFIGIPTIKIKDQKDDKKL